MTKQLFVSLSILLFLVIGTILAVAYGRGYRFGIDDGKVELSGTGLLVISSLPDGAQVFINDHLTTATDDTINLFPGEYRVKIVKDGYFPWEKRLKVQKEVVAKADARLFPSAPKLESITSLGVDHPVVDPSMTRLAYTVASQSATRNGIYVLDMTTRPILTLQSASIQIADDTSNTFSGSVLSWSPDGQELVATISATPLRTTTYLLDATDFNDNLQDVSATLVSVQQAWEKELSEKEKARMATYKTAMRNLIQQNFNVLSYSLDETKILYEASTSATLPLVIKPRLVGVDVTPEQRTIEQGKVYVYDIKEDKNYALPVGKLPTPNSQLPTQGDFALRWMPDSKHLLHVHDKRIDVFEIDGSNITTLYAGPFIGNYVFPWPNGNKILILTNLNNPTIQPNLYTIDLE